MGYIKDEEIAGYRIGEQMFHVECYEGNQDEIEEDDIITIREIENDEGHYFCDKCGRKI